MEDHAQRVRPIVDRQRHDVLVVRPAEVARRLHRLAVERGAVRRKRLARVEDHDDGGHGGTGGGARDDASERLSKPLEFAGDLARALLARLAVDDEVRRVDSYPAGGLRADGAE